MTREQDYDELTSFVNQRPDLCAEELFEALGWEDRYHGREDMAETPKRFAQMLRDLTTPEPYEFTTFESDNDEIVLVQDIPFTALCAHHVMPFVGKAHVAYVPSGRIAGLSKLARCVQWHAAGLQVQEDLTAEIVDDLTQRLNPLGVAVVLKAEHTCMTLRGVQASGTVTSTSKMTGVFADHTRLARAEFFNLIGM